MSRTQSSVSGTLTTTSTPKHLIFNNEAEYKSWLAGFNAQNANRQPVIDFRTYKPENPLEFECTLDLKGRLYPHPCRALDLYLLDFIDRNGTRRDVTDLYIYPYIYPTAEVEPEPLEPMGTMQGRRGPVDLYVLNAAYQYEICDARQQRLKGIAFLHKNRTTLEPYIHD